jgi:hypothetical protein
VRAQHKLVHDRHAHREALRQAPERARDFVDDGHGVAPLLERARQLAPHPAAADDDDVHHAS